jgi:hypothetical protein
VKQNKQVCDTRVIRTFAGKIPFENSFVFACVEERYRWHWNVIVVAVAIAVID